MALCLVGTMQKHVTHKPFVVLFDSGSSHTWWNIRSIPGGVVPRKVEKSSSATLAGNMESNLEITLEDITLPEFFRKRRIGTMEARVFTAECWYDAIIGRDMLREIGMKLDFSHSFSFRAFQCPVLMTQGNLSQITKATANFGKQTVVTIIISYEIYW